MWANGGVLNSTPRKPASQVGRKRPASVGIAISGTRKKAKVAMSVTDVRVRAKLKTVAVDC